MTMTCTGHPQLTISNAEGPDVTVAVWGDIDIAIAEALGAHLDEAFRQARWSGGDITVDCTAVTFMDSTGPNAFLRAMARSGGAITVRGAVPRVRRVLDLTGASSRLSFA